MDNEGFLKLSQLETATLVRLAAREHERRKKRATPPQGYSVASWTMELGAEGQLLTDVVVDLWKRLAPIPTIL